jgi:hypothetical protein
LQKVAYGAFCTRSLRLSVRQPPRQKAWLLPLLVRASMKLFRASIKL